jgi:glycosyltransferase involved in cell wall biosynthesis
VRIVHVAPFYAPVIGGVEEVVRRVAEYTASRGYETYVVTYNRLRRCGHNTLPRKEEINGVHVIRLKPDLTWSHGTYSSELPQAIKALKPDIVHVHVWRHPHVFQVAKLKRELHFKAILHGHAPFYKLSQIGLVTCAYYRLVDAFGRIYSRAYDVCVALTPQEAEKVQKLRLSEKITVVPNGVEEDRCAVREDVKKPFEILYLGRVSKSKNISLLIEAMVYVAKEVNDAELVIAGPDEGIAGKLLERARRKSLRITYRRQVSEEEKHRLYAESAVYALPSLYEGFGLTLLEAGIHGTPSVITGDGGQLYAAPPNVASLWAKPEAKCYAEAITVLLTDEKLRRGLGRQAREWAQQHDWKKILPKYEKLYKQITI